MTALRHRRPLFIFVAALFTTLAISGVAVATTPPSEPEETTTTPVPTAAPTTTAAPITTEAPATTEPVPVAMVAFAANATCDPGAAETTVTWTVTNNGEEPVQILDITEDVTLSPNPVPPRAESPPGPPSSPAPRPTKR